jgi:hypothetical protein
MRVLRLNSSVAGDGPAYRVRGHHPTVYPVQLPPHLDDTVIRNLNERFRDYLRREVNALLRPKSIPSAMHNRTGSGQSNASTLSAVSRTTAGTEPDDLI